MVWRCDKCPAKITKRQGLKLEQFDGFDAVTREFVKLNSQKDSAERSTNIRESVRKVT
jgi:hypothetical protein